MSRAINPPLFPNPPAAYSQQYMAQLVNSFALFVRQVQTPGPWQASELVITTDRGNSDHGKLSWNEVDGTLDLSMGPDVSQQIGFETYMRCTNDTGSTITDGTVVGFSGVNGEIKIVPFLADGSMRPLYFIGVATTDIADGETAPVTVYGKVRGIDTTGSPVSETWAVGDILYASPSTAGKLTKVRPSAPDAVVVVGLVLVKDASTGVIMVRPTAPIGMDYGTFSATSDQTLGATSTATAVTYDTTDSASGVSIGSPTSRLVVSDAGLYRVSVSAQMTSSSASAKQVYVWLEVNGSDVANSTRIVTLSANGESFPFAMTQTLELNASDYVRVMWASDSTDVSLDAVAATAFSPAAPAVIVTVAQMQL